MAPRAPESFQRIVGELPEPGRMPGDASPYETVEPARQGFVDRDGVKIWQSVWGESGPWLAFAPIYQISYLEVLRATVPSLSHLFRVITMVSRGTARSDRPADPDAYPFDLYYGD